MKVKNDLSKKSHILYLNLIFHSKCILNNKTFQPSYQKKQIKEKNQSRFISSYGKYFLLKYFLSRYLWVLKKTMYNDEIQHQQLMPQLTIPFSLIAKSETIQDTFCNKSLLDNLNCSQT